MSDLNEFLSGGKVDTSNTLYSEGRILSRERPIQRSFRLPERQVTWLTQNVNGNMNFAVSEMLEYAIRKIKEELTQGDYNIEDLNSD